MQILALSYRRPGTTPEALHAAFEARYAGEPFIRVMPLRDPGTLEGGFFDVQGCNDTNRVDIFVFANATQAIVAARPIETTTRLAEIVVKIPSLAERPGGNDQRNFALLRLRRRTAADING